MTRSRRRHQRAGGVASGRRVAASTRLPEPSCSPRTRILAAEQRLVAAAGRTDGRVLDVGTVDLALLESAANGDSPGCWAGRNWFVPMCTSGARLQLAIAPAGAGKTTAMRTLALAWTRQTAATWSGWPRRPPRRRNSATPPAYRPTRWPSSPGPSTTMTCRTGRNASAGRRLVIIDEAGMADTLSLDTAVQFIIGRGGSVRLIGDDQQLAAIGAGGVLRDIQASHGALRLTELHRFTDPAEAAATLALRDGRPEALGFYLDRRRVHVGDPTTTLDAVFNAWQNDRSRGLDAIMLAPTRELVSRLNQQAREPPPRRHNPEPGESSLADGNRASVGDLIITRANDRRLRITATDWVKNGDRWTVLNLTGLVVLRVRHYGTAAPSPCPPAMSPRPPSWVTPPLCIPRKA